MLVGAVTGVFGLSVAVLLLYLVRKDHLHVSHGLGWTVAILLFASLGFAPSIFDRLASFLGINYAPVLGLSLAIGALVIKALMSDLESTKLKVSQQRLIQKVSLLEADLQELSDKPPIDD
jgi:hypothetical protein